MAAPIAWPVVHACLAIPSFRMVIGISALAYFSSVCPVVACAPVLAAGASAPASIGRARVVARQRWWTAVRREVHGRIG
eukprot:5257842-Alexandrium_andersonii.AAC.1